MDKICFAKESEVKGKHMHLIAFIFLSGRYFNYLFAMKISDKGSLWMNAENMIRLYLWLTSDSEAFLLLRMQI